jgi:hypothetical protein
VIADVLQLGTSRAPGKSSVPPESKQPLSNSSGLDYFIAMSTVREIEAAIEKLPLPERLQLYKDMPQLIGRSAEDLDWQRLGLENFFHDDSPEDNLELTDEAKTKLDQSRREIAGGQYTTRQSN